MKLAKKLVSLTVAAAAIFCLESCSKDNAIRSAADLNGRKIGVQGGTTGEAWVQENVKDAQVFSFASGADAAINLKNGAIDAVVFDELPSQNIVAQNSDLMIVKSAGSFLREEYGIAVQKGNTELLSAVNSAITKAKITGEYDLISSSFIAPADGNVILLSFEVPPAERTLRLGTNPVFHPFEYAEGSKIVGFDICLAQLVAVECGANLEVIPMRFRNLIPALASGEVDFIASAITITEERKQIVDFSIPYFESEQVIIVRK